MSNESTSRSDNEKTIEKLEVDPKAFESDLLPGAGSIRVENSTDIVPEVERFDAEFESFELFQQSPQIFTDPTPSDIPEKRGLMRWDEALTLEGQVEAILFAAPKPFSVNEMVDLLQVEDGGGPDGSKIEAVIQALTRTYKERGGGFHLEYEKGIGYQFRTVPAAAPLMERMFASRQRPLSRAALETLSIIAYRQPVTRADIEYIRGVDAGSIIKNLLERELITCVGRKEDAGRPMMFGTTAEFLRVFRLPTLNDLPPLAAFQASSELMAEAMQKLETQSGDIDVDEFMSDPELSEPDVSTGLVGDYDSDVFADSQGRVRVLNDESSFGESEVVRVGASYDTEGVDSDRREDDSHSKVAFSTGSSLEKGGGADAASWSDFDQRPDSSRDGDKD